MSQGGEDARVGRTYITEQRVVTVRGRAGGGKKKTAIKHVEAQTPLSLFPQKTEKREIKDKLDDIMSFIQRQDERSSTRGDVKEASLGRRHSSRSSASPRKRRSRPRIEVCAVGQCLRGDHGCLFTSESGRTLTPNYAVFVGIRPLWLCPLNAPRCRA